MLSAGLPTTTGWPAELPRKMPRVAKELLFPVADHFALHSPVINTGEVFFHRRCQQRNVRDFAEMFGDEPGRFFSRHPVQMIEPREVHRTRIAPEGAFTAQVEVDVKITHGQLAQAAVHRL